MGDRYPWGSPDVKKKGSQVVELLLTLTSTWTNCTVWSAMSKLVPITLLALKRCPNGNCFLIVLILHFSEFVRINSQ